MPTAKQLIYPRDAARLSSYCKYFFLGAQKGGNLNNAVPGGLKAYKNTGFTDANAWANSGYLTTGTASTDFLTLAPSQHDLDLTASSLVFATRFSIAAAPGSSVGILGSYVVSSTTGGIYLEVANTGRLRLYVNSVSGTTVNVFSSAGSVCDGNEHTAVFVLPLSTAIQFLASIDGIQASGGSRTSFNGLTCAGGHNLVIGTKEGTNPGLVVKWGSLQCYQVPGNLTTNQIQLIHEWPFRNPHQPIPDYIFGAK